MSFERNRSLHVEVASYPTLPDCCEFRHGRYGIPVRGVSITVHSVFGTVSQFPRSLVCVLQGNCLSSNNNELGAIGRPIGGTLERNAQRCTKQARSSSGWNCGNCPRRGPQIRGCACARLEREPLPRGALWSGSELPGERRSRGEGGLNHPAGQLFFEWHVSLPPLHGRSLHVGAVPGGAAVAGRRTRAATTPLLLCRASSLQAMECAAAGKVPPGSGRGGA